jgi:cell division GTPase FtsZ
MKLALIGFGQAGGKIVDAFVAYDEATESNVVASAVAINTARVDLMGLEHIPLEDQLLIGVSRVKGHGVGADNKLGAEIAQEDLDEIQGAIDDIPVHEIDAFLVVAGLGGGTGSGGAPVLARHLKRLYTEPVYALGVLPAESEGSIYSLNAARSFKTLVPEVDNLLLFDNDAWRKSGESMEGGYDEINQEIVKRFGILFGAGEIAPGQEIAENVVDASEIINTLAGGGVSTIGYAVTKVRETQKSGLLGRFRNKTGTLADPTSDTNRIMSLVRSAALGRLTLPCDVNAAERGLLVVAGPPKFIDRKGVERGRQWLEEVTGTMVMRGGDYPVKHSDHLAAVILLSGVTNIPRIKQLQERALETIDNIAERDERSEANLRALVEHDDGDIDSLY